MTAPVQSAKPAQSGKKAPVMNRPFLAGTRRVDKQIYDQTRTQTTGTSVMPQYEVDPNGFYRRALIYVQCTTAANAATVAFAANGPFTIIDTIQFNDQDNRPILGPMTGWDLYVANKYGGYNTIDDAKQSVTYSAVTGAGATGGSFSFVLPLPLEIVPRTGLGSLQNKNANAVYTIQITLGASTSVYTTPPTTLGSVRVRIQDVGWMEPNGTDARGNAVAQVPPGINTLQYWSKQTYSLTSGSVSFNLQGLDSYIRNLIFILTDSSLSRIQGDSDFPDPFVLQYELVQPVSRIKDIWRWMLGESFGYTNAVETAGGRDYGVYPEWYTQDFDNKPGWETGLSYLPVSAATRINISGTIGGSGAHTLTVLANKVVPAGGNPLVLTGGR